MKKGQIKLSFGMIFSIILIIVFLAFAFYAIKTLLGIQNAAQTGKFISDLKSDIDRVWKSTESSEEREYDLPSKIDYVCFVDFEISANGPQRDIYSELRFSYFGDENMMFYPLGSSNIDSIELTNIALSKITLDENPFCIENVRRKVKLTLVKEIDEALVTITR
jgi:hypothetical protein